MNVKRVSMAILVVVLAASCVDASLFDALMGDVNLVETPEATNRPAAATPPLRNRSEVIAALRRVDGYRAQYFKEKAATEASKAVELMHNSLGFLSSSTKDRRAIDLIGAVALVGVGSVFAAIPLVLDAASGSVALRNATTLNPDKLPPLPQMCRSLKSPEGRELYDKAVMALRRVDPDLASALAAFERGILSKVNAMLASEGMDLVASSVLVDPNAAVRAPLVWGLRFDAQGGTVVLSLAEIEAAAKDGGKAMVEDCRRRLETADRLVPARRLADIRARYLSLTGEIERMKDEVSHRQSIFKLWPGSKPITPKDYVGVDDARLKAKLQEAKIAREMLAFDTSRLTGYVERHQWNFELECEERAAHVKRSAASNDVNAAEYYTEVFGRVDAESMARAVARLRELK